jgi:murein tripeptide amidase MpaA
MKINTNFDGGSIEIVDATDNSNVQLKLGKENNSDNTQWFYFECEASKNKSHTIRIVNAGGSSFPKGWIDYQAVASYDKKKWFRVPTQFDGKELVIQHAPEHSVVSYAYFTPYTLEQHQALISRAKQSSLVGHTNLGISSDNNSIDLLTIGEEDKNRQKVWLIARQHPGETMAEWFIEGLINRLLSGDESSKKVLQKSIFYIAPNMNPKGSFLGNHRTNSKGLNLNREWDNPSRIDCPEVYYVQKMMDDKGIDLFIDVHGDEEIPYNFMMGGHSSCQLSKQADEFKNNFAEANSDFQTEVDYNTFHNGNVGCCGSGCGKKNLSKATYYVEEKFKCLSLILEMPFIDNANAPDENVGWSAERSYQLGYSIVQPILKTL